MQNDKTVEIGASENDSQDFSLSAALQNEDESTKAHKDAESAQGYSTPNNSLKKRDYDAMRGDDTEEDGQPRTKKQRKKFQQSSSFEVVPGSSIPAPKSFDDGISQLGILDDGEKCDNNTIVSTMSALILKKRNCEDMIGDDIHDDRRTETKAIRQAMGRRTL